LLLDVSSGNLWLLLGLRVGWRVHADVHPSILANIRWLLDAVDGADFAAPGIVDELQREVKFVGHTALLALLVWTAESSAESTILNLAAALEQTSLYDLVAQPAVVFAPSACGASVLAVMPGESILCLGNMLVDSDGVDVHGLPPSSLQLAIRGPASSHKELRVLRDGQGLTLRERLCSIRDLLKWQSSVVGDVAEQHVLHKSQLDLMRCATNAVAYAFGNSRHGWRTAWTTTRFALDLLPATRSSLEHSKDAVGECLER